MYLYLNVLYFPPFFLSGLSVVEDSLWHALPDHYHTVDNALKSIGQPPLPVDCCLLTIGSWMGGDRDGNPYVTAKLTERVVYLSKWRAAHMYWMEVGELMWDLSVANSCSAELELELERIAGLANARRRTHSQKYSIPFTLLFNFSKAP